MTGQHLDKYLKINKEFPSMAGNLEQTLKAQRRLVEKLSKGKHTEDIKNLIVSVAGSIEVTEELLKWIHNMLKEVGIDAEYLVEGAKYRNIIRWQSELISEMMDAKNNRIEQLIDEIRNNMKK